MTYRENFIRAMRRDHPEQVPFIFQLCPSLLERFFERTGRRDFDEYYDFPVRFVELPPTKLKRDFTPYFRNFPANAFCDEWGVGYRPGSLAHFTEFLHPMADFDSPEQVWAFPEPDVLADYRWEALERQVADLHRRGYPAVYFGVMCFEVSWYLRGLDNLLADMLTDEDMAEACLERVCRIQERFAARCAEIGCDAIMCGDDVGTQRGMMMSPELWRRFLKPREQRIFAAAKAVNPDILIAYHSDGRIYDVIDELSEIGMDILNPVQPECVDPHRIKEQYGDRLSFWGTVGTQTVMPFGTPEDVRSYVKDMCETVGRNGGLVLAPTHMLEPDVPFENIEAFVSAAREFGRYQDALPTIGAAKEK